MRNQYLHAITVIVTNANTFLLNCNNSVENRIPHVNGSIDLIKEALEDYDYYYQGNYIDRCKYAILKNIIEELRADTVTACNMKNQYPDIVCYYIGIMVAKFDMIKGIVISKDREIDHII